MLMNALTQELVLLTLFAKTWKAATTVNAIKDIKRMLQTKTYARVRNLNLNFILLMAKA